MTFSKLINAEQKNEHKIMKDAHIAETDCWKEQICILNDALMSPLQIQIRKLEKNTFGKKYWLTKYVKKIVIKSLITEWQNLHSLQWDWNLQHNQKYMLLIIMVIQQWK